MIRDKLERIRERAYALWERAGRGHGHHEAHWHQASTEIEEEDARAAPTPRNSAKVRKPASSKTANVTAVGDDIKPSSSRRTRAAQLAERPDGTTGSASSVTSRKAAKPSQRTRRGTEPTSEKPKA